MRSVIVAVWVIASAGGCVRSQTQSCGDGATCPDGRVCATYLEQSLCVAPEQVEACAGILELGECGGVVTTTGLVVEEGTCHGGACLPIGCGNGRIDDPIYNRSEECDDHNRLSHDGCSSSCRNEAPTFDELRFERSIGNGDHALATDGSRSTMVMFGGGGYGGGGVPLTLELSTNWVSTSWPLLRPVVRQDHALASDGRHRRTILFGGRVTPPLTAQMFNDLWTWDGTTWTSFPTVPGPSVRADHAIAYDPMRGVLVLFGGEGSSGPLGDTWEWDGEGWSERMISPAPSAMSRHALVFDPARGVVVLVGEAATGVETWEYDGSWRPVASTLQPSATRGAAAAFDGIDRRIVLSGAERASAPAGETWTYDAGGWLRHAPTPGPMGRAVGGEAVFNAAAATDPTTGRVILNGGYQDPTIGSALESTGTWDGTAWQELPLSRARPPARIRFAGANDLELARLIVFGGAPVATTVTDAQTWVLERSGWRAVAAVGPETRSDHTMAYDVARKQTVLFGGLSLPTNSLLDDTWLWANDAWIPGAAGPAARWKHAMVYDAKQSEVVMFGGANNSSTASMGDTWTWDGVAWRDWTATPSPSPSPSPSPRHGHAMGYDHVRNNLVLFGGATATGELGDTWIWEDRAWRRAHPTTAPFQSGNPTMAWDAARQRLVLVLGGRGEAWEWDGSDWTPYRAVPAPLTRPLAASRFDGAGIMVFGNAGGFITAQRYRWDVRTPSEACGAGDHDRDGRQGCADRDCWAFCTPTCPPGTSCFDTYEDDFEAWRRLGHPGCGDGTCSTLETCQICPQDCGTCAPVCGDAICSPSEDCVGDCAP